MINIVANNTTLTNTLSTIQKENCMLCDKINSLKNKLAADTGKAVPVTTKIYTIPWPCTGNPDHYRSTCSIRKKNIWPNSNPLVQISWAYARTTRDVTTDSGGQLT